MPLHQLAVAPADVSGARLGLAINMAVPQPLAACRLDHPNGGCALLLGVLGASHVVTVEHADRSFCEEISCSAGLHGGTLPDRMQAPGYRLRSKTDVYDEQTFRRLAEELRERCRADTGWLGGVFPGDDAALTALVAEPDDTGWRWRTWHLYPAASGGTVVRTSSRWRP
ncbi:DUF2617 family protein [Mycobacterium gastri]|uniref:DUF2617 domain-containing protein n=1 Tax=Mycobacterium gastri TaxID=1777 RepID=A0A1X1VXS6_MYCGS|nr:DUF2617 family protein [Mycobacterium gastri]ETW21931.1 hypothetical protein MGAST_22995 [Mycobacterium gastri 'Wayne']ORV74649.1 hypothetical protein AWC07_25095 [Mycobacterium gastri]